MRMKIFKLYKNRSFRIVLFSLITLSFFSTLLITSSHSVGAGDSLNSLQQQYQQLQSTINNINQQVQSTNNTISNFAGQIQSYQALISAKQTIINNEQAQINQLNIQITQLNNQITQEQAKIAVIKGKINSNAKSGYEQMYVPPAEMFIGNPNINNALASVEYFNASIQHQDQLAQELSTVISTLNANKATVALNQKDATNLYNSLLTQQQTLISDQGTLQNEENAAITQKNGLTSTLISDQNQQQQILSQINSLTEAAYNTSGFSGCIRGNSWYYCQQWYGRLSGEYGTSINMTYGCLVASIAMVATKEISPMYNPPMIASMTWFSNDNMMAFPNIPGYSIQSEGYGVSAVNQALAQGIPAIVYLAAPAGEHWIVIYSQLPNGDYLINDPWYGSALTFLGNGGGTHEYYDFSQIGQVLVLQ